MTTLASLASRLPKLSASFSLKEQTFFFKRLAFLINASVPLNESLSVLREQSATKRHVRMYDQILNDVESGKSLSIAFGKFPNVFSEFSLSIVKVGEQSGALSQNLSYLADELKKKQILQRKLIGAFIYPALITLATLGITAFLILYLFPKITPVFASLHATLPISTRVVMAVSVFMQNWGLVFIAALFLFVVVFIVLLRKSSGFHYMFDAFCLRVPVLGGVLQYYNLSNASRTLGLLLRSGVKLSDALPITADATPNRIFKDHYRELSHVVERGDRMSSYLKKRHAHFPQIMSHMVSVGERSGTLSETLLYLADLYDHEVEDFTKNLSTLIEPALMVFMGVLVGFIAISIITPIYAITQNLHT
jgi:type II secretory pathway component PulF